MPRRRWTTIRADQCAPFNIGMAPSGRSATALVLPLALAAVGALGLDARSEHAAHPAPATPTVPTRNHTNRSPPARAILRR
ncbi:MAG: hypothetical protein IPJ34_20925 [Myxococcales bacterium]|nr:hypothetical protein [Myxococcales bacterium]